MRTRAGSKRKDISKRRNIAILLPVPQLKMFHSLHLLLKLKNSVEESFGRGRTSGNVDVDGDDAVATADHRIRIMIVTTAICATAHRDNEAGLWHLIIYLSESRRHFVSQSPSDNNDVCLSGTSAKHDAEAVHIVSGRCEVHHLDGATRQTEGQRPQRALSAPIDDIINSGQSIFRFVGLQIMLERRIWLPLHLPSSFFGNLSLLVNGRGVEGGVGKSGWRQRQTIRRQQRIGRCRSGRQLALIVRERTIDQDSTRRVLSLQQQSKTDGSERTHRRGQDSVWLFFNVLGRELPMHVKWTT